MNKYRDKNWLYENYVTLNRTQLEIAKECNVSQQTIQNWVKAFSIKKEVKRSSENTYMQLTCVNCGKEFTAKRSEASKRKPGRIFCTRECWINYKVTHRDEYVYINTPNSISLICEQCGKEYTTPLSTVKVAKQRGYKHHYCSSECESIAKRNEGGSNFIKDRTLIQNKFHSIRWSADMRDWKNNCLKRDENTCQMCGTHSDLVVHHIIPITVDFEKALDVNNGITLCKYCHKKTFKNESSFAPLFNEKLRGKEYAAL